MGVMGVMGVMRRRHTIKTSPAQRDSEISILKAESETTPAWQDSGMSNLGLGLMSPMGPIGLMGKKPAMKTSPAQRDSKMILIKEAREG